MPCSLGGSNFDIKLLDIEAKWKILRLGPPPAWSLTVMANPALELSRFALPTRIRKKPGREPGSAAQVQLIERIAALPYVRTLEHSDGTGLITACVYLRPDRLQARQRSSALLLCRVSHTGISVEGLSDPQRHLVLCRGWGRLEQHRIQLYLPRDEGELEVCWSILYRAYTSIIDTPERLRTAPCVLFDDLPKPSRTSLT